MLQFLLISCPSFHQFSFSGSVKPAYSSFVLLPLTKCNITSLSLLPGFVFLSHFPLFLHVFMSCNDNLLVGWAIGREKDRPEAVKPVILSSPLSGMCGEWREIRRLHCCNFSPSHLIRLMGVGRWAWLCDNGRDRGEEGRSQPFVLFIDHLSHNFNPPQQHTQLFAPKEWKFGTEYTDYIRFIYVHSVFVCVGPCFCSFRVYELLYNTYKLDSISVKLCPMAAH